MVVTISVGEVGTGTGGGDVTAVSDVDEMAVITGVCDVGTRADDVTVVSDVGDVALKLGGVRRRMTWQ